MQSFVRMTKLPNISGRAGYISNPDKQEEIVMQSEAVDWQPYVAYEQANQKTDKKNNQGRELVIALYNEWYHLPPEELREKVQTIVESAIGKSTDMQWAVHWNKDRTNFHVHVIFSERTKEETKRWDRDIYHTADGKVARKKADRAKDADGNDLPPVHRKGDLQGGFSAKDTRYKRKGWLQDTKEIVLQQYKEWGVQLDEKGVLHQYHEGKGSDSAKIKEKNKAIKLNNEIYEKVYSKQLPLHLMPQVQEKMKQAAAAGKVLYLYKKETKIHSALLSVDEFRDLRQRQEQQRKEKAQQTAAMAAIETQHQTFKREEPVQDKSEAPMQQRQLSLTDQIKNADKKQHSMADWNRLIAERNRTGQQQQQPKQQQKKKKDWERD